MGNTEIGIFMVVAVLGLVAMRMTVAAAMLLVGGIAYAAIVGMLPLESTMKTMPFSKFTNYSMSVLPFFLLMGEFASRGGMNKKLFRATRAWMGHWHGGLAVASIGGCAAFGAVSGSSLATAATMSKVALPEMREHGYSAALSTGTLAAGGTLGILIPPSVILVIYAIFTEQSVGILFVAAVVPGLLAAFQYGLVANIFARLVPDSAPRTPKAGMKERITATLDVWQLLLIFGVVVFGIYNGWFSPTEGAAMGAFATFILAVVMGGMRFQGLVDSVIAAGKVSAMMFLIMLGAQLFGAALALSQLPTAIAEWVVALDYGPYTIVLFILIGYIILGCFMESLAMVLLTLPVFVPVILALDFGFSSSTALIWFGILVLMSVETGLISPPFGLNLFLINSIAKDVPIQETYKGVLGYYAMDIIRILLVLYFPAICLWLPGLS